MAACDCTSKASQCPIRLLPEGPISSKPLDCSVVWRLGYELGAKFTNVSGAVGESQNDSAAKHPATV